MPLFFPSRILRAAAQNSTAFKWSETLNLPKSAFPARPTPAQLEHYRQRCVNDLYVWQRANRLSTARDEQGEEVRNEFVLHDGPPYANGAVHVGHALNKILKDLVLRWHLSSGKRVQYRPGWDCHGLPIELKALQARRTRTQQAKALKDAPKQEEAAAENADMSAPDIRKIARELAESTIETQKKSFQEWGVMGEWDKPYKTMDPELELAQLKVFGQMAARGLISRRHRPVYWSPSSRTALAEAELEYDDNHKCTAAFVKMPFVRLPKAIESQDIVSGNVSALIWTTTPWTLPANRAIAVNPEIEYMLVSLNSSSSATNSKEQLLIAKDRITHVLSFLPEDTIVRTVIDTVPGSKIADGIATCFNLFSGTYSPILRADYVTATSGTGLVHTAPGHGMEDYQLCQQNDVDPAFAPVDEEGRFTSDAFANSTAGTELTGLLVESEGAQAVLRILADAKSHLPSQVHESGSSLVLAAHQFSHKNPIDWRTKQPVIVRATAQWFADLSVIKGSALAALEHVRFVPEGGKTRLQSFIDGRSQWCISRQRAWGVPIPALYHRETGEACLSPESVDHLTRVIEERGSDAWFSDATDDPAWLHSSLEPGLWVRGKDTMDVWFDSGTTWTTLKDKRADVYLEGTDQHRGWFQSSLLTSIATQQDQQPRAPFDSLITHGFTLDAEGRKMSKSIGNVISPEQIVDGSLLPPLKARKQRGKNKSEDARTSDGPKYDAMGPDVLRLWVASSDYTRDVSISIPVLQSIQQALQKYRVTFKFLIGVLADCDPAETTSNQNLTFADRAVLHRLALTLNASRTAYSEYKFYRALTEINNFVNLDLSSFYFEIIKDAMYTGTADARRRTQGVLLQILDGLTQMLGPICPHLIEEVWEFMPEGLKESREHPLRRVWESTSSSSLPADNIETSFDEFKKLSAAVKLGQEEARNAGKLGSGLACEVQIKIPQGSSLRSHVEQWQSSDELADLLVVSGASLVDDVSGQQSAWRFQQPVESVEGASVSVVPPTKHKCVRCWKFVADEESGACGRCLSVLDEKGFGNL